MPDKTPHIPMRDQDGYRDLRTPVEERRIGFATHTIIDDGRLVCCHPAASMALGSIFDPTNNIQRPTLRMNADVYPSALVFVPTADELRALGEAMIATADTMEREANDQAAAALARAMGKGGDI